jgi:hypothetical protein
MDDYEVQFCDSRGRTLSTEGATDMYDALEIVTLHESWVGVSFAIIWCDGEAVQTFGSHDEAMESMLTAVGRA